MSGKIGRIDYNLDTKFCTIYTFLNKNRSLNLGLSPMFQIFHEFHVLLRLAGIAFISLAYSVELVWKY